MVSTVAAVTASLAAGLALWGQWRAQAFAERLHRHEFQAAALQLLDDITTGDVAGARNTVGTWRYGRPEQVQNVSRLELMSAFYTLTWCIERVAGGYAALKDAQDDAALVRATQSLEWHSQEIVGNLSAAFAVLNEMDSGAAWPKLKECAAILGCRTALVERGKHDAGARADFSRRASLLRA